MKFKTEISLHNKFEFEVKDTETGVIRQKAYAYNLVTDGGIAAALQGLFRRITGERIAVGTGSARPVPSNTKLNNEILAKQWEEVEVVIDEDEGSAYQKTRILVLPSEAVGESIVEVGLKGRPGTIGTHAVLQDSEGNPISIDKTDVDEITVYSTLYIKGEMGNGSVVSVDTGMLYDCFLEGNIHGYATGDSVRVGTGQNIAHRSSSTFDDVDKKALSSSDIVFPEKGVRRCYARYETEEANMLINAVGTDCCRINLVESDFWNGAFWEGQVGVGDGVTKAFNSPFHTVDDKRIGNKVSVDGLAKDAAINKYRSDISLKNMIIDYKGLNPFELLSDVGIRTYPGHIHKLDLEFADRVRLKTLPVQNLMAYTLEYSNDGIDYIEVDTYPPGAEYDDEIGVAIKFLKVTFVDEDPYERYTNFKFGGTLDMPDQIILEDAPAEGMEVTAKLFCDGIPKDDKHVVDVTIDVKLVDGNAR